MIERLDFRLDDFTRVQWAPEGQVWEEKFRAASNSYQSIEIMLVAAKVKPSSLLVVSPSTLAIVSRQASVYGLIALVLGRQGSSSSYAATSIPYVDGQPYDFRVAICTQSLVDHWLHAWEHHDDETIGVLLGYPECCRRFFSRYWVDEGFVDTTWVQAANTAEVANNVINVHPNAACNVTLRHLGLRWVSHLPCSFKCQPTIALMADYAPVIKEEFPEEYRTLSEALQWPVRWTALHGIAEITTPVCRIISRTDATPSRYVVNQHGPLYPENGARGTDFPFRNKTTNVKILKMDTWTLNGFGSHESMRSAHNTVYAEAGDMRGKSIIDLGCGTGELLQVYNGIASELHGVDIQPDALKKAKKYVNVRELNIYDPEVFNRKFDVAFISVQRFIEDERWPVLLATLKAFTKETVFYSYGEMDGWQVIEQSPRLVLGPNSALKVVW